MSCLRVVGLKAREIGFREGGELDFSEQEKFWSGSFGDEYSLRNQGPEIVASNISMFAHAMSHMVDLPKTVLEFGANVGLNFLALRALIPDVDFTGVEVNQLASQKLGTLGCKSVNSSIQDFESSLTFDLTLLKGVLIHINPDQLPDTYAKIYEYSAHYILLAEYYNPTPVEVPYRGHSDRLYKRDFAGEMLDMFPNLRLVASGFAYHRAIFPQDDLTWFLLEKNAPQLDKKNG